MSTTLCTKTFAVLAALSAIAVSALKRRHLKRESLRGKLVVITGASSGLGAALANSFAAEGANILAIARNAKALDDTLDAIRNRMADKDFSHTQTLSAFSADVSSTDGCTALVDYLKGQEVHYLVNNAGIGQVSNEYTMEDAFRLYSLNIAGPAALSGLLNAQRYVFIASPQSFLPMPGRSLYASSKAAVHSFASCLRLAGKRVTVAYPGWIKTNLRKNAVGAVDKPVRQNKHAKEPSEVADEIVEACVTGKNSCCLSAKNHAASLLLPIFPSVIEYLIKREYRNQ